MKNTVAMLALAAALGVAVGVIGSRAVGAQQKPITINQLINRDVDGVEGKVAHMYTVELAPGVLTPRHWHPGNYFAYVLEGSGFMEEDGRPPIPLTPGTPYYIYSSSDKPAYWHAGRNGSTTEPLKLLVVLIGDKGQLITNFEK